MRIEGDRISLRPVMPRDEDVLLKWENENLEHAGTGRKQEYTRKEIREYISSIENVKADCQQRFVIEEKLTERAIGTIDLFDVDLSKGSASIGVLVAEQRDRGRGHGIEALDRLVGHAFNFLGLNSLKAKVKEGNIASERLFSRGGFIVSKSSAGELEFEKKKND